MASPCGAPGLEFDVRFVYQPHCAPIGRGLVRRLSGRGKSIIVLWTVVWHNSLCVGVCYVWMHVVSSEL